MDVKHRMGEERAGAFQLGRECIARAGLDVRIGQPAAEGAPHRLDDLRRRGFIERNAERAVADPQIDVFAQRAGNDLALLAAAVPPSPCRKTSRIWAQIRACAIPPPAPPRGDAPCGRYGSAPPGHDRPHTSRRSPPAAPARCRCWKSLFRAGYAARGSAAPADRPAVPANRSTARRCGRAVSASSCRAPPYRPHAVRHIPWETPKRCADPTAMSAPSSPGAAQQRPAPANPRPRSPARLWRAAQRSPAAKSRTAPDVPGYCSSAPKHVRLGEINQRVACYQIPAQRLGAGAQHRQGLRMHFAIDKERSRLGRCLGCCGALRQRHRFRRRCSLIQQRGVSDIEPGQVADHGLEIEQRLQPALADLRLIRRIGRVPGRVSPGCLRWITAGRMVPE